MLFCTSVFHSHSIVDFTSQFTEKWTEAQKRAGFAQPSRLLLASPGSDAHLLIPWAALCQDGECREDFEGKEGRLGEAIRLESGPFLQSSLRVECRKWGKNGCIMKQMLILCAYSLGPPEDNISAAQEHLAWLFPSVFCCSLCLYQPITSVPS